MKTNYPHATRFSATLAAFFCLALLAQSNLTLAQDSPPGMPQIDNPPVITSLNFYPISQNSYMYGGRVQDENPGTCIIRFSNLVNEDVSVDPNGSFAGVIQIPHSGIIQVRAIDAAGQVSELHERYLQ